MRVECLYRDGLGVVGRSIEHPVSPPSIPEMLHELGRSIDKSHTSKYDPSAIITLDCLITYGSMAKVSTPLSSNLFIRI